MVTNLQTPHRHKAALAFLSIIFYCGAASAAASLAESVVFYPGSPNQQTSSFLVNPNSQVADGNQAIAGIMVVRDVFGNPISNQNVVFTTPSSTTINCTGTSPTNSSGQASVTCTSTKAQSTTLEATLPSFWSQSANITLTPGNPNLSTTVFSSNSPAIANNSNSITATLILRDAFSNAIPGQAISFSTTATNATFLPTSTTTDANGMATAKFYSTKAQTASATAQFSSTSLNTPLVFVPGPPSTAYSSLVLDTNSQVTNSNITYSIYLADAYNNPLPNHNVVVSISGIGAKITPPLVITDANANFQSTVTSPYLGSNTIRASATPITLSQSMAFTASSSGCGGNPNYVFSTLSLNAAVRYFDIGDVNNDGYADIVFSYTSTPGLGILYGQGGGAFNAPVMYSEIASPNDANTNMSVNQDYGVTVRDLDMDGYDDIILSAPISPGYGSVLFGSSTSPLTTSVSFYTQSSAPVNASVGDINGDGFLDVVYANYSDSNIIVMYGTQTHDSNILRYAYAKASSVAGSWSSSLADVDDDGWLDVLLATNNKGYSNTTVMNVFWGAGNGNLTNPNTYITGKCPQITAVGHFSSSTYLDVLSLVSCNSNIVIFPGQGTKVLGTPWVLPLSAGTVSSFAVGDLDGDGVLDLVTPNASSKSMTTYLGKIANSNNFTASKNFPIGYTPTSVKVYDLNQDGHKDIAFSASNTNSIGIFTFVGCN